MANGSFGLSGLPSAPTTVGSAPNNPLTPVSVAVNSTAGFQAGDLVYNYAGDVGPVPGNYVATDTFSISDDLPAYIQNVSWGELQSPPVTSGQTGRTQRFSDKLTNGNIVIVYQRWSMSTGSQTPYFKIIDENGTVVVTDTQISATAVTNESMISVCALAGGGFAVGWINVSTNNPNWAIYSNTGTVVTAVTAEASITAYGYSWPQVVARPDGSWIFLVSDSTNNLKHKIFSATGTQVYTWTTSVPSQSYQNYFFAVVRADNTFVIFNTNVSNYPQYICYSATNTVAKAVATIVSSGFTPNAVWGGATLMSTGDILVTYSNGNYLYRNTINSSNTLSAQTNFSTTINSTTSFNSPVPKTLSNGNYILTYYLANNSVNPSVGYTLGYAIYNSSHVLQSTPGGNYIYAMSSSNVLIPNVVETTNFYHVFQSPQGNGSSPNQNAATTAPRFLNWAKISPTTFKTVRQNAVSTVVGTSPAQATSGYARAASTPTLASFLSSTTTTVSTTTTAGTLVTSQAVIDSTSACTAIDTASLNDGSCVVYYRLSASPYTVKLVVISSNGSVGNPVTIASSGLASSSYPAWYKIAVLPNGKFICSYLNNSNQPVLAILSSSYAVESTTTITTGVGVTSGVDGIGLASLTNNRFVMAYRNTTGYLYARMYDSSFTILQDSTAWNSNTGPAFPAVAGLPNGFVLSCYNTVNGAVYMWQWEEYTTNGWSQSSQNTYGGSTYGYQHKLITSPSTNVYDFFVSATTQVGVASYYGGSTQVGNLSYTTTQNLNTTGAYSGTVTAFGDVVAFAQESNSSVGMISVTSGLGTPGSGGYNATITGLSLNSTNGSVLSAGTLRGHTVVLAFTNTSNYLSYIVVTPNAFTTYATLTAGVTTSTGVSISSAKGFSLVGVSSTAAPANGQGTVVINGPAQLNSNYSASTTGQSFNFQNPVTFGAAGTISGRNVNLIGNV